MAIADVVRRGGGEAEITQEPVPEAVHPGVHGQGAPTAPRILDDRGAADMDRLLDDVCVALSLLLQHGAEPRPLASSMGRLGDGKSPASIVGALADLIAREAQP